MVKKLFLLSAIMGVLSGLFPLGVSASVTTAPIAVVMCFNTGEILYDKNMNQRWIPASKTKSMTAFIVYREIEAGNITLNTQMRVSANAARFSQNRRVQGSFVPLNEGAYITVETLLRLMMLPSANAAGVVIAEHISGSEAAFVERMNSVAAELGMYAGFVNSHGAEVHYSNAYSMAVLVREFIARYPDILRITAMPSVTFNGHTYGNTNQLVHSPVFPGADGFKTGSLRQAGWGHSVTAERDGRRVIAVVMNTPNNAARQQQSRRLLEFGFEEIARREAERAERVRVFYHSDIIPLDTPPVVSHNRVMLPIRGVFEWLGYSVEWHEYGIIVLESECGNSVTLFIDRGVVVINGETHTVNAPAQTVNGRIFVSEELVAMVTGTSGTWDVATGVVQFR
ncbi:MAG: stalk domain-containing protein [Defluviitaleaceae bacterium]|nr:stalk domain-containing protein [Defluviitaleaceae bacterium]